MGAGYLFFPFFSLVLFEMENQKIYDRINFFLGAANSFSFKGHKMRRVGRDGPGCWVLLQVRSGDMKMERSWCSPAALWCYENEEDSCFLLRLFRWIWQRALWLVMVSSEFMDMVELG